MPVMLERRTGFLEQTPQRKGEIWHRPLAEEIVYLRNDWRKEGLPHNWVCLPGIGFMPNMQMKMFEQALALNSPLEREEALKGCLAKNEEDIRGFVLEYLARGLVFPIFYKIHSEEGEVRLKAPLYGGRNVVDTISPLERNGAVKRAFEKKIEPLLVNSLDGSVAVMTSPDGWSGLHDEQGHEIEYPDSQTYICQKRGREVVGFTIRTDFSKGEHLELLRRLGVNLSEEASEETIVENVAFLDSSKNFQSIDQIVDAMVKVRSDLYGSFLAHKKEGRSWQEIYQDLARRDELWRFDQRTKVIVDEFNHYVLLNANRLSKQEIQEALAVTILRLARFLGEKNNVDSRRLSEDWQSAVPYALPYAVSYGSVFEELKEQGGCAGGGESESNGIDKILVNSFTPRLGLKRALKKSKEGFACPRCNYETEMPVGDKCPSCGLTKEEYAKNGGKTCS